jgi:hypothetical protein
MIDKGPGIIQVRSSSFPMRSPRRADFASTPSVQTSKLLTLPVELLDDIFDDAWAETAPIAPPCKRLELFWRPRFWRTVRLDKFSQVVGLVDAFKIVPERAPLVRTLIFASYAFDDETTIDRGGGQVSGWFVADPLRAMFEHLKVLEVLDAFQHLESDP